MSSYEVKIHQFEGPMDLLLYLVQKNELNPRDISISEITDQFLEYIKDLSNANLSIAGDFLFMASRLMAMKARELLPRDEQGEMEELEFDADREALIRQMLEYQKFKSVSDHLRGLESHNYGAFYRGRLETARKQEEEGGLSGDAGIFQLFRAFQKSLKTRAQALVHTIELDDVTIEDRQQHIDNYIRRNGRAMFEDLLGRDRRRVVAAVTFMALLEMIKMDMLIIRQSDYSGVLWIYRKKENMDFADEMSRDQSNYTPDPELKTGLSGLLRERTDLKEKSVRVDSANLDQILKIVSSRVADGYEISEDFLDALLGGTDPESITEEVEGVSLAEAETQTETKDLSQDPLS
jgi:chromatin segregation and condensation protein Rec8/ScpA/Scc1 (kleisin family)